MVIRSVLISTVVLISFLVLTASGEDVLAQAEKGMDCLRCHQDQAGILETKHGAGADPGSPVGRGEACAACHGINIQHESNPSQHKHPVRFDKGAVPARQQTEACMSCHAGNRHLAFWETGRHGRNDVRCNDCHAVHAKPPRGSTIAITRKDPSTNPFVNTERQFEYETCITCHKQTPRPDQQAVIIHHLEGKVTCSSCHNPHGSISPGMIKHETVNVQCESCHAEKRGSVLFSIRLWRRTAFRARSAQLVHAKLLNEKVPNLCQDCHDWSRHPGTRVQWRSGIHPSWRFDGENPQHPLRRQVVPELP